MEQMLFELDREAFDNSMAYFNAQSRVEQLERMSEKRLDKLIDICDTIGRQLKGTDIVLMYKGTKTSKAATIAVAEHKSSEIKREIAKLFPIGPRIEILIK